MVECAAVQRAGDVVGATVPATLRRLKGRERCATCGTVGPVARLEHRDDVARAFCPACAGRRPAARADRGARERAALRARLARLEVEAARDRLTR